MLTFLVLALHHIEWGKANDWNVALKLCTATMAWIYIFNSVDRTKLLCYTLLLMQHHSFLIRNLPPFLKTLNPFFTLGWTSFSCLVSSMSRCKCYFCPCSICQVRGHFRQCWAVHFTFMSIWTQYSRFVDAYY